MYILAFETSCDDTSIALFRESELITMDTKSQIRIHQATQGVVPEVAAREHANSIFDVLQHVLDTAKIQLSDIDYIAVTTHPGLLPSLLTGVTVAGTISQVLKIPIIAINHIEAHIFSNFLERKEEDIVFPVLCLTASGGHTELYLMKDMFSLEKVGGTQDDAAGEAFDKVAKMMDLGYPGGPIISQLATEWEKNIVAGKTEKNKDAKYKIAGGQHGLFPRVWLEREKGEFSFSGLKTSVKREIETRKEKNGGILSNEDMQEISYEFSQAILEVLSEKFVYMGEKQKVKTLLLAGGVSANDSLRMLIQQQVQKKGCELSCIFPTKKVYCMDNAAMIGITAYYKIKYARFELFYGTLPV